MSDSKRLLKEVSFEFELMIPNSDMHFILTWFVIHKNIDPEDPAINL